MIGLTHKFKRPRKGIVGILSTSWNRDIQSEISLLMYRTDTGGGRCWRMRMDEGTQSSWLIGTVAAKVIEVSLARIVAVE